MIDLQPGEMAKICGFHQGHPSYRQKLLAMGLTPETEFEVIRRAPFGDPIEIRVRNFYLSLRQEETALLKIERVNTPG